jgi:HPt (histidine-containing phosphotransfer) domain-containing protein
MPADPEATRLMLATLWQKTLPAVEQKLQLLQRATDAAARHALDPALRAEASGEAHKLAGSLGMFGYPAGTDFARTIEQHLDSKSTADAQLLQSSIDGLYTTLNLQPAKR